MTVEQFNNLDEQEQKVAIFEAKKVTERFEQPWKFELFQIDNFFIETKISLQHKFKRVIATFPVKEVPLVYSNNLPLVLLNLAATVASCYVSILNG